MKKVYLIRHALPDFPQGQRMCLGTTDIPLGETGLAQAKAMAAVLPPVTAVFSSPLARAVQTARAIGREVHILDGLREMHAGLWDGLTFEEIRVRFPQLYAARGLDPSLPLPGAETVREALPRFRAAMEEAARQSPGDFAVVSHGGITAEFLRSLCGVWRKPLYTEVISLVYHQGQFYLPEQLPRGADRA